MRSINERGGQALPIHLRSYRDKEGPTLRPLNTQDLLHTYLSNFHQIHRCEDDLVSLRLEGV